jgi:uncharacterized membrane protein YfcA
MEIIGYFLAILMGFILGLLGGGGAILTVPILVYFFGIPAVLATGYSLLVVGLTSALGSIKYYRDNLIDFRVAIWFSIPSMLGVFLSRKYVLPIIPENFSVFKYIFNKDQVIMLAFALLVLLIALFMFKSKEPNKDVNQQLKHKKINPIKISFGGLFVGIITGFFGAGGGFIIVPSLMLLANITLRKAIATSLLVIALKSLAGLASDRSEGISLDWYFLSIFMGFTICGVILGSLLNNRISIAILRKGFAYFVFVMGLLIVVKELL